MAAAVLGAASELGIPGTQLCGVLRALAAGGVTNTAAALRAVHLLRPRRQDIDRWLEVIVEMKIPAYGRAPLGTPGFRLSVSGNRIDCSKSSWRGRAV